MPPRPSTSLFEDAIDVPAWLENDRLTPYAMRTRRDRDIGSQLATTDSVQQVRLWWQLVERVIAESPVRRNAVPQTIPAHACGAYVSWSLPR